MNLDTQRFLEDVTGRYARSYQAAVSDLLVAIAMKDRPAAREARLRLGRVIAETMGVGEVLGASITLRAAADVMTTDRGMAARLRANYGAVAHFAGLPAQTIIPRVTFDEAVRDMVQRVPVTLRNPAERTAQRIAQLYGEGNFVAFVRSAEDAVTDRVRDLIAQAIKDGIPEASMGRLIRMGVDKVRQVTEPWTDAYAKMAFRTNLNTATTAGRFRQVRDPEIREIIPGMQYMAVGDSDTRPNHMAADGVTLAVDDRRWAKLAPPLGYSCFLPGTRVAGAIRAGSKAMYSGPAVKVQTQSGLTFAVTVNHPVLTASGWIGAGQIKKGFELVRYGHQVETLHRLDASVASFVASPGWAEDDQQAPPTAEQCFEAFAVHGTRSARPGPLPLDFHGDGRFVKGQIDVVSTDGVLPEWRVPALRHLYGELALVGAAPSAKATGHRLGSFADLLVGSDPTLGGFPGGSTLPADDVSVVSSSLPPGPLQRLSLGAPSQSDATTFEFSGDGVPGDPKLFAQLQDAHPGQVSLDRVVDVELFAFHGPVYDFESEYGWIVAEGIVMSNCRCTVRHISAPELRRMGGYTSTIPAAAGPDPGFRHGGRPDLFLTEMSNV